MKHFDFVYKEGLNIYDGEFDNDAEKNGLFFCSFNDIPRWLRLADDFEFVWHVDLCMDSKVYTYKHKMKTNKLILRDPIPVEEFIKKNFNSYYLVACDKGNLKYTMEEQQALLEEVSSREKYYLVLAIKTRQIEMNDLCLSCVQEDGMLLRYVVQQTIEICLAAIRQTGRAFTVCKNHSEEIEEAAVKKLGTNIGFVRKQTPELCLLAVRSSDAALLYIKNQTEEICAEAVKHHPYAIIHVEKQTPLVAWTAYKHWPKIRWLIDPKFEYVLNNKPKFILH